MLAGNFQQAANGLPLPDLFLGKGLDKGLEIKILALPRTPPRCCHRLGSPPNHPRHQGTAAGFPAELLDFHSQHFNAGHLFVQELHYPGQFVRDAIGDEQQAQPGRPQVGFHLLPESIGIGFVIRLQQLR